MYRLIKGGKPLEPHLRVMNDQTVPLVKIGAQRYPIGFLQSIDKALAVRPSDRFQSVADWRNALGTLPFPGAQPAAVEPVPPSRSSARFWRAGGLLVAVAMAAEAKPSPKPAPPASPAPSAIQPGQTFRDCPDCPDLVAVSAGNFLMGSTAGEEGRQADEGPTHRVQLAAFALGKYEISREEWERFAKAANRPLGACDIWQDKGWRKDAGANWSSPGFAQTPKDPAVCIGWDDAKAYVQWQGQQTGKTYRLPSEAEWEYAARAGSESPHDWDKEGAVSCTYANIKDQAKTCNDKYPATAPAGSYKPNAFGLYDLLGNAREWVEDCWHPGYDNAPADGKPWTDGGDYTLRVLRGGSWADAATVTRYANRDKEAPATAADIHGFRVARSLADSP